MSLNRVSIIGNLGQDPEVKQLGSGPVCNFSVAVNEKWTGKDGQKQERTEWVRCSAFGKQAELIGKYLSRGRQVYLDGRLQTREYEKNGERRFATEVVVNNVVFLGSGKGDKQRDEAPPSDAGGGGGFAPPADDDIPF